MKQVGNTILAKGGNHILAKRDNSAWPKGSKLSGFSNALAQVFYEALMEQLINEKADFVKPHHWKPATLSEKEGNEIRQDNGHAG